MKKVLIVVDETRGSKSVLSVFNNTVRPPEEVILLHVQRLQGRSIMIDMLGDAEMSTLRESMKGTEYKERLDRRAERILNYYKKELENGGLVSIKTVLRDGNPTEEILRVADKEKVDFIIIGCNGRSLMDKLISGCVAKDVEKCAKISVLIAKNNGCKEDAYAWKETCSACAPAY